MAFTQITSPRMSRFGTVCSRFSKWFASYTGTLTGSKTDAKRHKDVEGMLERGELLTMEEFYEVWTEWKELHYRTRKHRGLTDAKEKWVTPGELFARPVDAQDADALIEAHGLGVEVEVDVPPTAPAMKRRHRPGSMRRCCS